MNMFNPEYVENKESMFESRRFSPDMLKQVKQALEKGAEIFPDVIMCPNKACGTPVRVVIKEGTAILTCVHCSWSTVVRLNN